jgi:hypothetical protein
MAGQGHDMTGGFYGNGDLDGMIIFSHLCLASFFSFSFFSLLDKFCLVFFLPFEGLYG